MGDSSINNMNSNSYLEKIKERFGKKVFVLVARLFLGSVFVYASIYKIADPESFVRAIYNYHILPGELLNIVAVVLPWLELFVGVCLIFGILLPGAIAIVNALLLVFLGALLFNVFRGLDVECGCFGSATGKVSTPVLWYLIRDAMFISVGIYLFWTLFDRKEENRKIS
jgi:uncharacterized membrane protein YphA (DoxX/SURF4 family)